MKLRYLKGLFKTHDLRFVSAENVFGDYYVMRLKLPYPMTWEPGQHGAFTLPGQRVKGKFFRAFSVASVPSEGMILLGTRTGSAISAFKQTLTQMHEGDIVRIRGPLGWFVPRDDTSPIVLLATGIGITPVRSILYSLKDDTSRPVHLIHSSSDFHLFSDELKLLEKENSQMRLTFAMNRDEFRQAITAVALTHGNSAFYYVSGSPAVVRSTKNFLKGLGILRSRIISESFLGY
ncbi:MAG: FAD-dependent oxidoreductase [Sphaerochaeta sp.]|nr:FAD-dependent oxidoreductase [Sphaerochaeta sp.]